jgi:hypothetical protein
VNKLKTFSFIVRISIDEGLEEPGQVDWHGQVTHVPRGKGRHIHSLDEVMEFVAPYLIESGVPQERAARSGQTTLVRQGERIMAEITWKLDLTVTDGPKFTFNKTVTVDAYERVDFDLPSNNTRLITLGPSAQLILMMVKRGDVPANTIPPLKPEDLYYIINKGSQKGKPVPLDSVHLLFGSGVDSLLEMEPTELTFYNRQPQPTRITMLLARNIPEPPAVTGQTPAPTKVSTPPPSSITVSQTAP